MKVMDVLSKVQWTFQRLLILDNTPLLSKIMTVAKQDQGREGKRLKDLASEKSPEEDRQEVNTNRNTVWAL